MGGSAFAEMLIGMVRVKFVAVLLGPSGVGILGVYNSIVSMFTTVAGMGIPTGGVQRVVKAYATEDEDKIAITIVALRRLCFLTGMCGMLVAVIGCSLLSKMSFGNADYSGGIALLGIVVFLGLISIGQASIIRANRRITDMAQVNILGALCGTVICIPCYYFWGVRGIAPSLLIVAIVTLGISWRFFRRISIKPINLSWIGSQPEIRHILQLGLPLMLSGLTAALVPYLARILLIRQLGLDGVGLYQAAFNLSSVLVSFILAAMGADYYPRLTLVANDHVKVKEEVNTQTEIALLLGVPGLAATIVFAPFVIATFYSSEFTGAVSIMRWSIYGIFGQLVSWPLGIVILAKGKGKTFFLMELISNSVYLVLLLACTYYWGLQGAGIAFFVLYILNTVLRLILFRILADGHWSRANFFHILLFLSALVVLGLNCALTQSLLLQWTLSSLLLLGVTSYCLSRLQKETGWGVKALIQKMRR